MTDPWGINYPGAPVPTYVGMARQEMELAVDAIAKALLYSRNEDYEDLLRALLRSARKLNNVIQANWQVDHE